MFLEDEFLSVGAFGFVGVKAEEEGAGGAALVVVEEVLTNLLKLSESFGAHVFVVLLHESQLLLTLHLV